MFSTRLLTERSSIPRVSKKHLVVLFGPTAVGKTAMTEKIFSKGYEIINSDSVQVYKRLDIGSAKPDLAMRNLIPHHLVDVLEPWEQFTVGDYCNAAERITDEIIARGNVPLLTGGTAYYFRQFLFGSAETPVSDPLIRAEIQSQIEINGKQWAHSELEKVDPVSASRININDIYRVSRALEVYRQSGRPLSSFPVHDSVREELDPVIIALHRDKRELDERIAQRVDIMFDDGLLEEIESLKREGATLDWPGMQGIGYKEFFDPELKTEDEIKQAIIVHSRQYAKRQMTFFRSFKDAHWMSPDDEDGIRKLLEN